jgi:hypothetical protein
VIVERNTWWDGKVMRARDFAADTEYLLDHHRLHNRLLHGWGIVCGLYAERHPRPECAQAWILVTSGLALDCHGRELVLTSDVPFELPDRAEPYLLCARFKEEKVEPVPALFAEGICDPHHSEFNRYRDGVSLVVADVTPQCWQTEQGGRSRGEPKGKECKGAGTGLEHGHDHGCGDTTHREHCLDADCPCGDLVPLARVIPLKGGGFELDLDGRRVQPPPAALLTHITHVNWPHGGALTLRQLREDLRGELRIRFDRPLRAVRGAERGVNPYTFTVQYSTGPARGMEFLPYPEDSPPRLEDDCVAVFTVDPAYLARDSRRTLRNVVVYVSLRCDFIQDRRGVPVDGSHLGGRLPSGNGVQGGLFESWFEVRDNDEDRRAEA